MIVAERSDAKAKVYPPPAETWTQHRYFSDCGVEWRLNGKPEKQAQIIKTAKPIRWQDEPSRVCGGNEWDKYYFFSEPATSMKGRNRIAAQGPDTFVPEFVAEVEKAAGSNIESLGDTTYERSYRDIIAKMRRTGNKLDGKKQSTLTPHIFPDGHITFDELRKKIRKAPVASTHICMQGGY